MAVRTTYILALALLAGGVAPALGFEEVNQPPRKEIPAYGYTQPTDVPKSNGSEPNRGPDRDQTKPKKQDGGCETNEFNWTTCTKSAPAVRSSMASAGS